jgi:hypothetical protein
MIGSLHVADMSVGAAARLIGRPPTTRSVPGLQLAVTGYATPVADSRVPMPRLRRVVSLCLWDREESLDEFLRGHRLARPLASGWRLRLQPVRANGTWPGMPNDLPNTRAAVHEGPAAVLAMARVRPHRFTAFLRSNRPASASATSAPGLLWATGMTRPPQVATISLWDSSKNMAKYAYGRADAGHPQAIAADEASSFFTRQAFIRFHPYLSEGSIDGLDAWENISRSTAK